MEDEFERLFQQGIILIAKILQNTQLPEHHPQPVLNLEHFHFKLLRLIRGPVLLQQVQKDPQQLDPGPYHLHTHLAPIIEAFGQSVFPLDHLNDLLLGALESL